MKKNGWIAYFFLCPMVALVGLEAKAQKVLIEIEKFNAPEKAFYVVSTLIMGPKECIVFDGQYKVSDGKRLAQKIEETGKTLKAIIISHADHDHYMGAMEIVKKFPGTPVYMSASTLEDFNKRSVGDHNYEKNRGPDPEVPETLITPIQIPDKALTVDGQEVLLVENLVGDVEEPVSTSLWIPSLKTLLAGDLVFDGLHPWLGHSSVASRKEWIESLEKLAELQPDIVVPGHKVDLTKEDSPAQIDFMISYLAYYDEVMEASETPEELIEQMKSKYPDLKWSLLMEYGAKTKFKK